MEKLFKYQNQLTETNKTSKWKAITYKSKHAWMSDKAESIFILDHLTSELFNLVREREKEGERRHDEKNVPLPGNDD